MVMKTIGVIGAGVMGHGVAHALALAGFEVVLIDLTEHILENALHQIKQNLRLYSFFDIQKQTDAISHMQVLEAIRVSTQLEDVKDVDFVIENVTEKETTKAYVYKNLDRYCRADVIFAVNTSAIPITRVGGWTNRPDAVIGMHFMNPVPLKPTVEVIRAYHTSDETINTSIKLLKKMNKEAIVVNDSPGFVTNRVMMLMVNEAIFLLYEGVAEASDIDALFQQCFAHKMGPLATADLIGLDTVLLSLEVIYENLNDDKYRPCPLLRKLVDAGLYGRKSGKGFYTY